MQPAALINLIRDFQGTLYLTFVPEELLESVLVDLTLQRSDFFAFERLGMPQGGWGVLSEKAPTRSDRNASPYEEMIAPIAVATITSPRGLRAVAAMLLQMLIARPGLSFRASETWSYWAGRRIPVGHLGKFEESLRLPTS
jgi:hypothetical protein